MPVLFKYTEPLLGVWKIEESSEELLSMLEFQSEYLPFLQQIKTEFFYSKAAVRDPPHKGVG